MRYPQFLVSRKTLPWILFWGLAIGILFTGFLSEFHAGHDGWCAARRAVAARNAVDQGFFQTNMGMVLNVGEFGPKDYKPYWHHPAGIHWLVTGSYTLLGEGTWQARLVPTLLMFANLFLFIGLLRRWVPGIGVAGGALYFLSLPMLAYYGPFVAHQPLMLSAALGTITLYLRTLESPSKLGFIGVALAALLGGMTAWAWYLFAAGLGLYHLLNSGVTTSTKRKWLLVFSGATVLGFALSIFHILIQANADFSEFSSLFSKRAGTQSFTALKLTQKMGHTWADLFNPYLVGVGFLYIFRSLSRVFRGKALSPETPFAFLFLATGLVWTLLFKQGASVHEYWPWYAAPFFVLAGASCLAAFERALQNRVSLRVRQGLVLAAIAIPGATGLGLTIGKHVHPAQSHPEWSESYFQDRIEGWKEIRRRTEPGDTVVLHKPMLPAAGRAQFRYYANRKHRSITVSPKTRTLSFKESDRLAAIHLKELPRDAAGPVLRDLARRFPLTKFGNILLVDLRPEETKPLPWVTAYTSEPTETNLFSNWLRPTAPQRIWQESPLLSAGFLFELGFRPEAIEGFEAVVLPASDLDTLHIEQRVALHNLTLAKGETNDAKAIEWLHEAFSNPSLTREKTSEEEPIDRLLEAYPKPIPARDEIGDGQAVNWLDEAFPKPTLATGETRDEQAVVRLEAKPTLGRGESSDEPAVNWLDEAFPNPVAKDIPFGDEVTLLRAQASYRWRYGVELSFLLQLERPMTQPWKPTLKGMRWNTTTPDKKRKKERPLPLLKFLDQGEPGEWVYFKTYAGLPNRASLGGVDYRFALWSAGDKKKGHRAGFLKPPQNHYVTWTPDAPEVPLWKTLLGLGWMRE